jgi:predicted Zn-dependent protease
MMVPLLVGIPSAGAEDTNERGIFTEVVLREREQPLIKAAGEFENQFSDRGYRYSDPELERWLREIGERLQPEATDPYIRYRFFVFRHPAPNAFALPDGQVYVHTGMLARLENEAQLAGLLAHEINHVAGHHGIVSYRSIRKKSLASVIAGATLSVFLGDLGAAISDLTNFFLLRSIYGYSRSLEQEADLRGIDLTLEAGYDAREMTRIFEILNHDPEGEQPRVKTKWSTHPQLRDRAVYLKREVGARNPTVDFASLRVGEDEYLARRRTVALMTVHDLIRADYRRSAVDLARALVEEAPEDPRGLYALGEAWRAMGAEQELAGDAALKDKAKRKNLRHRELLTRDEREAQRLASAEGRHHLAHNMEEARRVYLRAVELDPAHAEAHRGLGYANHELGRHEQAARALMRYLELRPEAPDKPEILKRLQLIAGVLRRERGGS